MENHKHQYQIQRWGDILAYAIVADSILILLAGILNGLEPHDSGVKHRIINGLASMGPYSLLIAFTVLILTIVISTGNKRWRGWFAISLRYPPLSISIICAIAILFMWPFTRSEWQLAERTEELLTAIIYPISIVHGFIGWGGIAFIIGITTALIVALKYNCSSITEQIRPEASKDRQSFESISTDYSKLIEWLSDNDLPIEDSRSDMFGHNIVAQRIASRVLNLSTDECTQTQALIGPLGSGKTSILNLVKKHIAGRSSQGNSKRIEFTDMSAWGYVTPEALISSILNELIRTVGRYTNTLGLKGIPARYTNAIEKTVGRLGIFAQILNIPGEPKSQLSNIDRIAQAIDLNIILWIEDLERFAGIDSVSSSGELYDRLQPIRAILYELNKLKSITVIIADTSLTTGFDIEKIARYVEHPPSLKPETVWKPLRYFRSECLNGDPISIIDPVEENRRKIFTLECGDDELHKMFYRAGKHKNNPGAPESLAIVLRTPRLLKLCMKYIYEVWNRLPGEMGFDDLMVLSAIRVSQPRLYAVIDRNIKSLRNGFESGNSVEEKMQNPAYAAIYNAIEITSNDDDTRSALHTLIHYLFPHSHKSPDDFAHRSNTKTPQSIGCKINIDYWERYIGFSEIQEEDSDQYFLRAIEDSRKHETDKIISMLMEEKYQFRFDQFVRLFEGDDILDYLDKLIDAIPISSINKTDAYIGSLYTVAGMMNWNIPEQERLMEILTQAIARIIPVDLTFAYTLVSYFSSPGDRSIGRFLSEENRGIIRELVAETFIDTFKDDDTGKLATAISEASNPYTPYYLLTKDADGKVRQQHSGWPQFRDILLNEAHKYPKKILPHLTIYLCTQIDTTSNKSGRFTHTTKFEYTESDAKNFFGDRLSEVLQLFRDSGPPPQGLDASILEQYHVVQKTAHTILKASGFDDE